MTKIATSGERVKDEVLWCGAKASDSRSKVSRFAKLSGITSECQCSQAKSLNQIVLLNVNSSLAGHDMPCLSKQCRS